LIPATIVLVVIFVLAAISILVVIFLTAILTLCVRRCGECPERKTGGDREPGCQPGRMTAGRFGVDDAGHDDLL
jgi:hypothetical protein